MERDSILFLLKPGTRQEREFLAGVVVRCSESCVVVRFEGGCAVAVGNEVTTYYRDADNHFVKQEFDVVRVNKEVSATCLNLSPVGESEVEEERSSVRIKATYEPMLARFGDEDNCVVLDISEGGMALIAGKHHEAGERKEFEMWIRDGQYVGTVIIRSVAQARRGKFRYGIVCDEDQAGENLKGSLRSLWVALQIKYLELLPAS